jgi:hypothetical protein
MIEAEVRLPAKAKVVVIGGGIQGLSDQVIVGKQIGLLRLESGRPVDVRRQLSAHIGLRSELVPMVLRFIMPGTSQNMI